MSKNVNRNLPYFLNAVRRGFHTTELNSEDGSQQDFKSLSTRNGHSYLYEPEYSEEDLKQRRRRRWQLLQPRGEPSLSERMRSPSWQSGDDGAELSLFAVSLSCRNHCICRGRGRWITSRRSFAPPDGQRGAGDVF